MPRRRADRRRQPEGGRGCADVRRAARRGRASRRTVPSSRPTSPRRGSRPARSPPRRRPATRSQAARREARGPRGPFAAARAQLAEGRARAGAGDREAALTSLIAAERAFHAFGATRRRDEAVRELRRLGHRVRRAAAGEDGPLTAREREIAELVAAGRTNREVAEQLVLSERTIEAHLRNVYAKLGVRSRVELARNRSDVL